MQQLAAHGPPGLPQRTARPGCSSSSWITQGIKWSPWLLGQADRRLPCCVPTQATRECHLQTPSELEPLAGSLEASLQVQQYVCFRELLLIPTLWRVTPPASHTGDLDQVPGPKLQAQAQPW